MGSAAGGRCKGEGGEYLLGVTGGTEGGGAVTLPLTLRALGPLLPGGGIEGVDLTFEVDIREMITVVLGESMIKYCGSQYSPASCTVL